MRYIILVLLNAPIIFIALLNTLTQYKLGKINKRRFIRQFLLWITISIVVISSFPLYNLAIGQPIFDSAELSLFDIAQTTTLIYLLYVINNQRRKLDANERLVRELHQEISIRLSATNNENKS